MGDMTTLQGLQLGSGVTSSAMSGFGQVEAGLAKKSAYDYNAAVAGIMAEEELESLEEKYSTLIGKQASLYAKAGVDIASGSPLLTMAATAAKKGTMEARVKSGADIDTYYGKIAAWAGEMSGMNAFLTGLSATGRGLAAGKPPTQPLVTDEAYVPGWGG